MRLINLRNILNQQTETKNWDTGKTLRQKHCRVLFNFLKNDSWVSLWKVFAKLMLNVGHHNCLANKIFLVKLPKTVYLSVLVSYWITSDLHLVLEDVYKK